MYIFARCNKAHNKDKINMGNFDSQANTSN